MAQNICLKKKVDTGTINCLFQSKGRKIVSTRIIYWQQWTRKAIRSWVVSHQFPLLSKQIQDFTETRPFNGLLAFVRPHLFSAIVCGYLIRETAFKNSNTWSLYFFSMTISFIGKQLIKRKHAKIYISFIFTLNMDFLILKHVQCE